MSPNFGSRQTPAQYVPNFFLVTQMQGLVTNRYDAIRHHCKCDGFSRILYWGNKVALLTLNEIVQNFTYSKTWQ
jgi:hypothetical protein